jgi:hypothetical protein
VVVEYSVYNANTAQFGIVTLVCQFLATGNVLPEAHVFTGPLQSTCVVHHGPTRHKDTNFIPSMCRLVFPAFLFGGPIPLSPSCLTLLSLSSSFPFRYLVLVGDSPSFTWRWLTLCEAALYLVVMSLIRKDWLVYKALGKEVYFEDGFAYLDLVNYAIFMVNTHVVLVILVDVTVLIRSTLPSSC